MRLAVLTLAVALAGAGVASAASIEGRWRTPTNNAEVEIVSCGAARCGTVVTSDHLKADPAAKDVRNKDAALRGRAIKGLTFLTGFTGGPTEWKGGKVYDPDSGNTYQGTITVVDADHLKLRGCIVYPLCKTQMWTRIR